MQVVCAFAMRWKQGILGIEIKTEGGWLTVVGTVDNSPASRGDLLAGDRIVRIDGKSTENKALSDCLKQLAGAPGEDVTLTVVREGGAKRFELTLTRASLMPDSRSTAKAGRSILTNVLTMDRGPVRWKGNKIVSRVLPYPDLISLTIRLPIAHAAVTGRGVKVAVVQSSGAGEVSSMIEQTAPGADVKNYTLGSGNHPNTELGKKISEAGCRVAVISWSGNFWRTRLS